MEEIMQILKDLDWSPLFISLKTGVVATFISFFSRDICSKQSGKGNAGKERRSSTVFLHCRWCCRLRLRVSSFSFCSAGEDLWGSSCLNSLILKLYRRGLAA